MNDPMTDERLLKIESSYDQPMLCWAYDIGPHVPDLTAALRIAIEALTKIAGNDRMDAWHAERALIEMGFWEESS